MTTKTISILLMIILEILIADCQMSSPKLGTALPIQETKRNCIVVKSNLPVGFLASGKILLGDFTEGGGSGKIMTLTSASSQPLYLPNVPTYWNGETSPDGKWFAYDTTKEKSDSQFTSTLIVLNAEEKIQFTLPWDEKWAGFNWLNNQQLEFPYVWDDYWQGAPPISDIITLPMGQFETMTPLLPDPWIPGGPLVTGLVIWKAVYDPTLSVVGYMRGNEPEQSFVLWDLKNNKELWKLNKWSARETRPEWTPDGNTLAVAILNQQEDDFDRFELYLVGKDGRAEKWIDIKDYFRNTSLSMSWSPNGRYIAIAPNEEQPFLILDTVTKELLDYCISSQVGFGHNPGIWSPDSTQIIVPRQSDSNDPSIVLDIGKGKAAYLTNNPKYRPIGWMAASSE